MQKFQIAEHKLFDVEGHDFLFMVRDNAIFEIGPETKMILQRCSELGEQSKEEFLAHMSGQQEQKIEFFEGLLRRRIVAGVNGEIPSRSASTAEVSIPLETLVLNVTDICNLGCLYCYHRSGHAKQKYGAMNMEVAKKAVDFLFDHSGNQEKVVLVFFGGEPLLNFKLISYVVNYAREKAAKNRKKVEFSVTTNGTLLTENVVRFIQENEIGVTVSIDGFEQVHDRYRRFPDGSPSYRAILPKIKHVLQVPAKRPVVARVTVANNPNHVSQIMEHLLELGFAEVGFAPVTTRDLSYQLDEKAMNRLLNEFRVLSKTFLEAALKGDLFGFSNLIDLLVVLHEGEIKNYPCGAGLGLFSVDPKGRLYLCQRLTGEEHLCLGDIRRGLDRTKVGEFRKRAEINQKPACKNCWVRTLCAGGCYHEALVREGSLTKPNLHYCEWMRSWVEIGLEAYGSIALHRPEYLDKLSALRGHATIFNQYD